MSKQFDYVPEPPYTDGIKTQTIASCQMNRHYVYCKHVLSQKKALITGYTDGYRLGLASVTTTFSPNLIKIIIPPVIRGSSCTIVVFFFHSSYNVHTNTGYTKSK